MKTWKDFYEIPFQMDKYCGNVIWLDPDGGYNQVWDWIENDLIDEYPIGGQRGEELAKQIIAYVNGEDVERPNFTWKVSDDAPIVLQMDGKDCICVRGWGNIHSTIRNQEASEKIQDEFVDWLVKRLNGEI